MLKYFSTCIHELGHFISGKLIGLNVKEVIIGEWSRLFTITLFGTQITFKLGYGGFNSADLKKLTNIKFRLLVFILGGVTLQLIALTCIYVFFGTGNSNNFFYASSF
ncbi:site-2 protease family protein [Paenibacillus sp. N3.4]|uniref:site-2 protease family protein n=1 Tax=Paenibacillus sp. N3.4 TaxID=2603222 RepID=UPI0037C98D5A